MTFDEGNFRHLCDHLALSDPDLHKIIETYGYPPLWHRQPTFESLIHYILEQQVSLASALAAMQKLKANLGKITPANLLSLSDEELKASYFSRQKIIYARCLANAIQNRTLVVNELLSKSNEEVSTELQKIKGIGNWTTEVFLMMSLGRADVFPLGDVALITSTREVKQLPPSAGKKEIEIIAETWRPYRSVAAFLLWHAYLEKRKQRKLLGLNKKKKPAL